MLDDPPTSPVRYEDQIVFGLIAAAVAYFLLMQFGGIYFLPAGLLVANVWDSGRRLAVGSLRRRKTSTASSSWLVAVAAAARFVSRSRSARPACAPSQASPQPSLR